MLTKLKNTSRVSKSHYKQAVCPFCSNWYHENETREVVDYCVHCEGSYTGALKTEHQIETLHQELSEKEKGTLTNEDMELITLLEERLSGYWSGVFSHWLKKLNE